MRIHGASHVHGPHNLNGPHAARPSKAAAGPNQSTSVGGDRLDISPAAEAAANVTNVGEVRQGLVDQIKQQIANGSYETAEKLDAAVSRLLNEIA